MILPIRRCGFGETNYSLPGGPYNDEDVDLQWVVKEEILFFIFKKEVNAGREH